MAEPCWKVETSGIPPTSQYSLMLNCGAAHGEVNSLVGTSPQARRRDDPVLALVVA